jgi:hypothetical protein
LYPLRPSTNPRKVRRAMIRMYKNYLAPKLGASHNHGT